MTISYNWLCDYLPTGQAGLPTGQGGVQDRIEPERLSKILTAIGLEVESLEKYESIKGGLRGLVIGEVLEAVQHPNADKLRLTTVNTGGDEPLRIVCGAPNVAAGQKVVVATVGTTIYPLTGEPVTMKVAKIRGEESHGMICAEDEIGIGESHAGIMVLPDHVKVGAPAAEYFKPYTDWIFEIGLTPNRMDAMSHLGVARDVCAYLSHHDKKQVKPKTPFSNNLKPGGSLREVKVTVENTEDCPRYSGVTIANVSVQESPQWLKDRLVAIGQRPINNIVDITNYVLHETGQPLHAFDADKIKGDHVIVKNLAEGTSFTTLDEKERKLNAGDLMICNGNSEGMCIAGVFGGIESGVTDSTKNIFLESACFSSTSIRRTSLRHGLRTDAATRFEKGVDISNTVNVLKRAAKLIVEIAGGDIASEVVDIYGEQKQKTQVGIKYHQLKRLSGKNYHPDAVKRILESLEFDIVREGIDELFVAVPHHKPDISLPADLVEEVIRIDGLDQIEIPTSITITPAIDDSVSREGLKEKIATYLVGQGFSEIMTNSITNSKYYNDEVLNASVKMINSLSADLDVMRPSMLETGLETMAFNLNRRNNHLRFFEFGKTYHQKDAGKYAEKEHLCIYTTGADHEDVWNKKGTAGDIYQLKGIATALLALAGLNDVQFEMSDGALEISYAKNNVATLRQVSKKQLNRFDVRQPVYFLDMNFETLVKLFGKNKITYTEVSKYPSVTRDLALLVNRSTAFAEVESAVQKLKLSKLRDVRLFDVFESDKLGKDKKSLAVSFTFQDEEKTMMDKEIDGMVAKLIQSFEKELGAEIRK
ncbi:MAG: phenylalanyl-tRNA synthetase beta chain [Chitinophagaceae bacterium]|jgi:phenylalanyl-tRNA synthetase beta chain|nr:phenylalanyl-tRNA synthetase beta chain [Chitinophagaceae bacterium]